MTKRTSLLLTTAVAAAALAGCGRGAMVAAPAQGQGVGMLATGRAITTTAVVRLRPGQSLRLRQGVGGKTEAAIPELGIYAVELGKTSLADLKKELGAAAAYVEYDQVVTMADPLETLAGGAPSGRVPGPALKADGFNDPMVDKQWGVVNTQQVAAVRQAQGGSKDVVVAIVDSGVDLDHPDLKAKLVKGYSATGIGGLFGVGSAKDDNGHGTHCAGIAAAITDNGVGISGMAANCKIMPVRVLAGPGSGSLLSVAKGIVWAANNHADVISLSLGGAGTMQSLQDAVAHALKKNSVVVAAMGNSGHNGNPVSYPAAYPGVISVGATDNQDKIAFFSSFNKYCSVSSPGVGIWSTTPTYDFYLNKASGGKITKEYSFMSGTSMATPLVAGLCGLIRSVHPGLAPAEVKALLERTADKVPDMGGEAWTEKFGHGRINALKAVTL